MSLSSIVAWGVICLIGSIAAIIGGITFLIVARKKPAEAKGRLIGIIIGIILIVNGAGGAMVSLYFICSSDWISKAPTATDVTTMVRNIQDSLENNSPDALKGLFANKGYSGEALDDADAKELFSHFEGNVTDVQYTVNGVSFEGNTHANSYVFFVKTDALKDYSIYFDFIPASDNDEYKGIQYIKMTSDGQLLFEAGAVPQLESR